MSGLQKVAPGSLLKVSASDWNAFVDAARDFQNRATSRQVPRSTRDTQPGIVWVRNDTGAAIHQMFAVLGLDGLAFDASKMVLDELGKVIPEIVLKGVRPDKTKHRGKFCILTGPVENGKLVRAYVLLDLEIPVRCGRPARIPNGQNLLEEIRSMSGLENLPVIVMTAHGLDGPDLAVEVMRGGLATDFIRKPFPPKGDTLEKRIKDALARAGRTRPGGAKHSKATPRTEPKPFEAGVLAFHATHVELEGIKVCGDAESGRIRKILDELRHLDARGRFVAHGGGSLAKKIGCEDRGQNGIAEAVRDFRKHVSEVMLEEANVAVGPRDVIESKGRGYRLSGRISIGTGNDPKRDRDHASGDPVNDPNGDPLNERQEWVLAQLKEGKQLRIDHLANQFPRSKTTAKRDLTDLRRRGLIEFEGSPRTGYWRRKGSVGVAVS